LWYRLFTAEEVAEINSTTVKDVILAVTNIPANAIQDNPFFLTGSFDILLRIKQKNKIKQNESVFSFLR